MTVDTLQAFSDNYVYLVRDGGLVAAVDPGQPAPVLAALERLDASLDLILLTHHHTDHTGGCGELKRATGCRIVGPDDRRTAGLDRAVRGGEDIAFGTASFRVLATPGHTRTHVAYFAGGLPAVWTGDALFACGCGRIFEGTPEDMWQSMLRLRELPGETTLYGGHDYTQENLEFAAHVDPGNVAVRERLAEYVQRSAAERGHASTMDLEKATNPFLRADTIEMRKAMGLAFGSPEEVLGELRRRKDRW